MSTASKVRLCGYEKPPPGGVRLWCSGWCSVCRDLGNGCAGGGFVADGLVGGERGDEGLQGKVVEPRRGSRGLVATKCTIAAMAQEYGSWHSRIRTKTLISERERAMAIHRLGEYHEAGYIDDSELARRIEHVQIARTSAEIGRLFVDLPRLDGSRVGGTWSRQRASNAERAAAVRKLSAHRDAGRLTDVEYQRRVQLVEEAKTPAEIADLFSGLPPVTPHRLDRSEQFASDAQRDRAIQRLTEHLVAGRLSVEEHRERVDQIMTARTREEVQAVFQGLPAHDVGKAAGEAAAKMKSVGSGVITGASQVVTGAVLFVGLALVAAVILGWYITGIGPTIPLILIGVLCFACALIVRLLRKLRPK